MSYKNSDLARRVEVQIYFAGVDITKDIMPYFLALDYTDNEEDEADDMQLKIQDRDGIWLRKWLNDIVQAAASAAVAASRNRGSDYKVTPAIGLNIRSGPGTGYSKYGVLPCGTVITVSSISNGWATTDYNGKTAYVCAAYLKSVGASEPEKISGMQMQAIIIQRNWNGDGKDKVLDCGEFELDSLKPSGPPATIAIKGTALPHDSSIRSVKKSRGWEAYNLSGIAREIAANAGMTCMFISDNDPYYHRAEQYKVSDIAFLRTLCNNAGISLKATNHILVLFDQASNDAKNGHATIKPGDGSYTKYSLSSGKADTEYTSCRVRYTSPSTGKVIEGIAYVDDYDAESSKNKQLEITAKVSSSAEAKILAAKRLRLHNKYERTASFTLVGCVDIVAGVNIRLEGWGMWDGKYVVSQAKHSVSSSGYTTSIKLRRALEGY